MTEHIVYVQDYDIGDGQTYTGPLPASEIDLPFYVVNAAGRLRARFESEEHAIDYAKTLVGGRVLGNDHRPECPISYGNRWRYFWGPKVCTCSTVSDSAALADGGS